MKSRHILIYYYISKIVQAEYCNADLLRENCATCPYITNGLTSYTFYATGKTRSITSHITCNTKNVIYMVVTVVIYNI